MWDRAVETKEGYGLLAAACCRQRWCLYRVKPKLHMQEHFPILGNLTRSCFPLYLLRKSKHLFFRVPSSNYLGRNGNSD